MSMLAIKRPGTGRRQADPNARIAAENRRLRNRVEDLEHQLAGAGCYVERLERQLREADEHIERQHAELRQTAGQLGTAVIQGVETGTRAASLERELVEQTEELVALRQFKINVCSVDVPAVGIRDIDRDDQPTEPAGINVRPLWDALGHKPTGPAVIPVEPITPDEDTRSISLRFATGEQVVTVTGGPYRTTA